MRAVREKKRLKAIKSKFYSEEVKCNCCGKIFSETRMWSVLRYGTSDQSIRYNYCEKCMPTKKDVLNEIDTDEIDYGIAGVDDNAFFEKKDYSRVHFNQE